MQKFYPLLNEDETASHPFDSLFDASTNNVNQDTEKEDTAEQDKVKQPISKPVPKNILNSVTTDDSDQSNLSDEQAKVLLDELMKVIAPNNEVIDMRLLKREIDTIRTMMVAQDPLMAPYIHELEVVYTWSVKTMATDGNWIFINPQWTNKLDFDEKAFVIYHEIMHCLLDHMKRGAEYNHEKFNRAADYEINAILVDQYEEYDEHVMEKNLKGLYNKDFLNMPAETIYNLIPDEDEDVKSGDENGGDENGEDKESEGGDGNSGDGKSASASKLGKADDNDKRLSREVDKQTGGRAGGLITPELGKQIAKQAGVTEEDINSQNKTKEDWDKISKDALTRATTIARSKGIGGGRGSSLLTILGNYHNSVVNWKAVLSRYVGNILAKTESKWTLPNRKYMAANPDNIRIRQVQHGKEIGKILVCVDTSGSMGSELIKHIVNEISGIIFAKKARTLDLILFDSEVYACITLNAKKQPPPLDIRAAGGTRFTAPMEFIKEKYKNDVTLCIFFTDGGDAIPSRPKYANNFIWIIYDEPNWPNIGHAGDNPAFGKKILVTTQLLKDGSNYLQEKIIFYGRLVTESIKKYIR